MWIPVGDPQNVLIISDQYQLIIKPLPPKKSSVEKTLHLHPGGLFVTSGPESFTVYMSSPSVCHRPVGRRACKLKELSVK